MGPGNRGKQTSLVLFCFFVRERDVNERASSDTGEAGFNSKARGGQPGSIPRLGEPKDPVNSTVAKP